MTVREKSNARFAALDLLRGLAAIAILTRHFRWSGDWMPPTLPRSYLAVDLFFILSGFVLAHAYGDRLRGGLGFGRFALARLVRLYPLYAVATLAGAALTLLSLYLRGTLQSDVATWAKALTMSLAFLPVPAAISPSPDHLYPFGHVAWSLFVELAVNLLFAALALQLGRRLLALLIAAGAVAMIASAYMHGSLNGGATWDDAPVGGARALFGFFAGVAVYRLHLLRPAPAIPAWGVGLALLASFAPGLALTPAFDVVIVLLLYPLLVWFGASALHPAAGPLLGRLSYPLYLVQVPVERFVAGAALAAGLTFGQNWLALFAAYALVSFAVAWLLLTVFDEPLRANLARRFRLSRPATAQSAP